MEYFSCSQPTAIDEEWLDDLLLSDAFDICEKPSPCVKQACEGVIGDINYNLTDNHPKKESIEMIYDKKVIPEKRTETRTKVKQGRNVRSRKWNLKVRFSKRNADKKNGKTFRSSTNRRPKLLWKRVFGLGKICDSVAPESNKSDKSASSAGDNSQDTSCDGDGISEGSMAIEFNRRRMEHIVEREGTESAAAPSVEASIMAMEELDLWREFHEMCDESRPL
jgi:hypothetical protein